MLFFLENTASEKHISLKAILKCTILNNAGKISYLLEEIANVFFGKLADLSNKQRSIFSSKNEGIFQILPNKVRKKNCVCAPMHALIKVNFIALFSFFFALKHFIVHMHQGKSFD